jgi:GNAT superfamily N-acetyltransferase
MSVPLSVRKAAPNDLLGIFKLVASMHSETDFRHTEFDPEKALGTLAMWIEGEYSEIFISVKDGEITGLLIGNLVRHWYSQDLFAIEKMFYVAPQHRGTRAAYKLVETFVQWGKDSNSKHITAGIASGSGEAGARLYERFGLKNLGSNFAIHI